VIPFNEPLVLVLPEPEDESLRRATTDLMRIGNVRVDGFLKSGAEAWGDSRRELRSYPTADVDALCRAYRAGEAGEILDVRQRSEWERSHIPGSRHLFVGDLPNRLSEVPRGEHVWAICATGHRSSMAASLLDRAGVPVTLVAKGGVPSFLNHCLPDEVGAG
jgi:hydroxyacylglutathione hydrolase